MDDLFSSSTPLELFYQSGKRSLTLEAALELFETVFMASRNFTDKTRVGYKTDVRQLIHFLAEQGITDPEQVGLAHLQGFLASLDQRGLTGITRRRKVSTIKTFFTFLTVSSFIAHNPTRQLVPPEREYKEPRFLSAQEYQALLRAASHDVRAAAVIELLLQTGIRLSEAANLKIDDVELPARVSREAGSYGFVHVQGKGRKERTLPIGYKTCRAIKSWLAIRPAVDCDALFVTKFREPMRSRAVQRLIEKYLAEAEIKNASVHTLRHTFATQRVAKGSNLEHVRQMLGHADLKTTSIYVSAAKDALIRDMVEREL